MALADYYQRGAQAASQVMAGFDAAAFEQRIGQLEVGISFGSDTVESSEGRALLDLLVRLLARFYPSLAFSGPDGAFRNALIELAGAVNPKVDVSTTSGPSTGVVVGREGKPFRRSIFAGCDGWSGSASTSEARAIGRSGDPFGAGIAACLAAGLLFRVAVLGARPPRAVESLNGAALGRVRSARTQAFEATLVGCGAIGNAFAWALARSRDRGTLQLVDGQSIELSNLQRYVLAKRDDDGAVKVDLLDGVFTGRVNAVPFHLDWQAFVADRGYSHGLVAVALDSAEDRRAVQASLPEMVLNAWTQPGDLGVSAHSTFGGPGACLACLYLPSERQANEDEIYARALGIPERVADIRTLLYSGAPVGNELIVSISAALGRPIDVLKPFTARPVRELYVRGICGGEILPLGSNGSVRSDVHVPLAHQSALAGVLLAARLTEVARGAPPSMTQVTQLDVLAPVPPFPTSPSAARAGCICRDGDFIEVFRHKWG